VQIFQRFDADRQTDQSIDEAGALARRRVHRCMGHGGRMRHQALHASERLRQREALEPAHELAYGIVAAGKLERHHCSETPLLALRELMPGVILQSRVPHAPHVGLALEPVCQSLSIAPVVLEPCVQRAQAPQREKAVERRTRQPQAVGPPHELLVQGRGARHHRAAHHVAVTVQVLRGRVHHEVGTEREGLLPRGRQEGVVDRNEGAAGVPELRDRGNVGDAQQRIARSLDPHQLRGPRQGLGKRGLITEIDKLYVALAPAPPGVEQPIGAPVAVVRRDDAPPHGHEVADHRDRCHAARCDDGAAPLLELRERGRQQVARGVARAGVVVAALLAKATKGKRRGEMQRGHDTTGCIVAFDAGAHRLRDLTRVGAGGRLPSGDVVEDFTHWMLRYHCVPVSPDSRGARPP